MLNLTTCIHGTSITQRCEKCEPGPEPIPVKQMLRVVLKTGGMWFDMHKPTEPDWTLPAFVMSVRAVGYMLNSQMYVPMDDIQAIFLYDAGSPPKNLNGVVIPFEKKP